MTKLEQLRTELDRYEAAHGTDCRHSDGRLESRQMIALIGRAVLELVGFNSKLVVNNCVRCGSAKGPYRRGYCDTCYKRSRYRTGRVDVKRRS